MIPHIRKKKNSVKYNRKGEAIADFRRENYLMNRAHAKLKRVLKRRNKKGYSCPDAKILLPLFVKRQRSLEHGAKRGPGVRRTGSKKMPIPPGVLGKMSASSGLQLPIKPA